MKNKTLKKRENIKRPEPGRLEIHQEDGFQALIGVPFFVFGVSMVLTAAGIIPVPDPERVPGWAWPVVFLMGIAAVAGGVWFLFVRRRVILDLKTDTIVKQLRLFVPVWKKSYPLSEYEMVRVGFEKGEWEAANRFPITLRGKSGQLELVLSKPDNHAIALADAEHIAVFLKRSLVDGASAEERVVLPAESGLKYSSRVRPPAFPFTRAVRPPQMRSRVEQSGTHVRIVVPAADFRSTILLEFAVPVIVLVHMVPRLVELLRKDDAPDYVEFFLMGLILLLLVLLPSIVAVNRILRSVRGRTTVEASAEGIWIETQGAWRSRVTFVSAGDIHSLDYGRTWALFQSFSGTPQSRYYRNRSSGSPHPIEPSGLPEWLLRGVQSKGVLVKTKYRVISFGAGLPEDEVRYLCALMQRALSNSLPNPSKTGRLGQGKSSL